MRNILAITFLASIVYHSAFGDDPPGKQRHTLPPAVGTMAPSAVVHVPGLPASTVLRNGTTNISGGKVEQKVAEESITFLLTAQAKIEHSSETNGSFTVSADRMRFSVPSDVTRDPGLFSLSDFDATGSCIFSSDSIRVSANRMVLKSLPNTARSTITFDGDVLVLVGKISASAGSITLTRTDAAWSLSGLLSQP